jgi:hypothetical protein
MKSTLILTGKPLERLVSFLIGLMFAWIFGWMTWAIVTVEIQSKPFSLTWADCIARGFLFLITELVVAVFLFAIGMVIWGLFKPLWVRPLFAKFVAMKSVVLGCFLFCPLVLILSVAILSYFRS